MQISQHFGNARLPLRAFASGRFLKCVTIRAGESRRRRGKSQVPNVEEKRHVVPIAPKVSRRCSATQKETVRVAIVDDEEDMRWLLKSILDHAGGFTCVGSFSSGDEALASIPQLFPDVVLMDIGMPGLNGIECTKKLKQLLPQLKIIIVTGLRDIDVITDALRAGAAAYLLKPLTVEQCLATLNFAVTDLQLTARELEVMRCIAEGLLYKEIADKLGISYSAVHKHQHKIFLKVNATNRSEAIRKWREQGGA